MTSSILDQPDHDEVKAEASRQIGRPVDVESVHISLIRPADTVFHEGRARTVCPKDLKNDGFMGRMLFGDSYVLGRRRVLRLNMRRAIVG